MSKADIRNKFIKPSLDPQKLSHFLAVYETGSFSIAAKLNNVTQQAVSKSIARMEDSLGVKLFQRSSLGVEATIFGETLARRAKVIHAESRLAAAELSALRGSDQGYVRIGMGWSFLTRIAPLLIEKFRARYPHVTVSIMSGSSRSLYSALLRGEVEFVASAPPVDMAIDDAITTEELFLERDMLIMRRDHPLAKKGDISLEDLAQQTWLVSMQLTEQWRRVCNVFLAKGIAPPENYVDLDSVMLLKSLLLHSDGVALLAREVVALDHERDLYHFEEGTDFPVDRKAFIACRRNSILQPLARTLRQDLFTVSQNIIDPRLWTGQSPTQV